MDTLKAKSRREARKLMKESHKPLTKKSIVHHKDHNPFNNDPSNLAIMTNAEHTKYHGKHQDPLRGKSFDEYLRSLESQINTLTIEKPIGWQEQCESLSLQVQYAIRNKNFF